ncbi:Sugar efflux transporter, partial [Haemophilus influenzae]
MSLYLKA